KEGRQPGLSILLATQQPSAIDHELLSQCDTILCHKLTARLDIQALNALSQDYMGAELRSHVRALARVGETVLVDDERERVQTLTSGRRQSQHGGGSRPVAREDEQVDLWRIAP